MADVKNTKEVLKLIISGYKVYGLAKADGKIDLSDLGFLMTMLPHLQPAFDDASKIPTEVKDLDAAEAQELATFIVTELGVVEGQTAEIINASLGLLVSGYKLYAAIKGGAAKAQA